MSIREGIARFLVSLCNQGGTHLISIFEMKTGLAGNGHWARKGRFQAARLWDWDLTQKKINNIVIINNLIITIMITIIITSIIYYVLLYIIVIILNYYNNNFAIL